MGYEHEIRNMACGCIQHYEYDEACGMGPIAGSQKTWYEKCELHGGNIPSKIHSVETKKLSKEIAFIQSEMDELKLQLEQKKAELEKLIGLIKK